MNNFEKIRDKKVFEIIIILKVIYMILSIVSVLSFYSPSLNIKNAIIMSILGSILLILAMVYFLWMAKRYKEKMDNKVNLVDYLETILILIIFTTVIMATGVEQSEYKLLGIFVVLIATIQFGKKYSIIVSILCFIIIMGINFSSDLRDKGELNIYFEKDLVLATAIFVVAIVTGMYVETEKEHSKELKDLANKDELTGLYNHRYFQENLDMCISVAQKDGQEVSLLFMDIDYFKNYNDINGHQSGDLVLKQVGIILNNSIREQDIVARYGGEEFAVILPNTGEKIAIKVGEKIREAIQNTKFKDQENQPNKNLTMSIGVSSYPIRANNKHQLINTADDALYRAKSFNRNRVESYHSVFDDLCKEINIEEDTIKSLKSLINKMNKRDRYTYGHTERVVIHVKEFCETLGLNSNYQKQSQIAAYLHDIGKLEIPSEILNKKDKLTQEEYDILKKHSELGTNLISHIPQFKSFVKAIKHHHERYDGTGYPDNLKGEEIPYLARVIAIADSFDAMTSNRSYNVRKSHKEAIEELIIYSGTQFDPNLVEKFIEMLENQKENL